MGIQADLAETMSALWICLFSLCLYWLLHFLLLFIEYACDVCHERFFAKKEVRIIWQIHLKIVNSASNRRCSLSAGHTVLLLLHFLHFFSIIWKIFRNYLRNLGGQNSKYFLPILLLFFSEYFHKTSSFYVYSVVIFNDVSIKNKDLLYVFVMMSTYRIDKV